MLQFLKQDKDLKSLGPCTSTALSSKAVSLRTPKNTDVECKVCGNLASSGYHFGGHCCHACGAFFRRSVSNQQQYSCARNETCKIKPGQARNLCKACRFKRCIAENMRIQAIVVRTVEGVGCYDHVPTLKKIYLAQRATYVNRYAVHLKECRGNKALVCFGIQNPTYDEIKYQSLLEFQVLQLFLSESGFLDLGLTPWEIQQLAIALRYAWILNHSIIATLKNSGHQTHIRYFMEESYMKVNEEAIGAYVNSFKNLLDYDLATKHVLYFHEEILKCTDRISQLKMESYENAALFQCFAMKTAAAMFPRRRADIRQELSRVFDDLKSQYVQNYENVALRMGNLILILSELENATQLAIQNLTLLHLNGYNYVTPKIEHNK